MNISTLYLCEQGAVLRKKGGRLQVERSGQVLVEVPARFLKRVMLFGNIQLTTQAAEMFLYNGTDVSYLSTRGRYRGRLVSNLSKNIYLRQAQHLCWLDRDYRTVFARRVVEGKVNNMLKTIKYYRRLREDLDISRARATLEDTLEGLGNKGGPGELLGAEGSASAAYYKVFTQMVSGDFSFPGRRKRPAPDPVNALMSLGYTLVTNELTAMLEAFSLDPYLGFLHGVKYGRPSLALDVVEDFRQPLVDRFTLRLINKGVFKPGDFYQHQEGGVYLKEAPFKVYLDHYNRYLRQEKEGGKPWQVLLRERVEGLKKELMAYYQENRPGESGGGGDPGDPGDPRGLYPGDGPVPPAR